MRSRKPTIIFILMLIAIIVFLTQFNVTPKIDSPYTADKPTQQTTKEEPQNILDIQKQIEEQIRKEQEVKAEQERLSRLQNPELITSNLREVGTLITFTGEKTYKDKIVQKGFLNARGLLVNLVYEFGIGCDLNKIYIDKIEGDKVTINIPKVALEVQYIKRLNKDSAISGTRTMFAKEFKPSEIDFIYEQSQEMVLAEVNGTHEYFDKAYESLKDNLEGLIKELGYSEIKFVEI